MVRRDTRPLTMAAMGHSRPSRPGELVRSSLLTGSYALCGWPAGSLKRWFAFTNQRRIVERRSGPVSGLVGTAIEHTQLFFGDCLVERQRLRLEVALRRIFRLEVKV